MKKIFFLISALTLMFVASCTPEENGQGEEQTVPAELIVDKTEYSVGNGSGTIAVPVDANDKAIKVTIKADAQSWLSYKETKAETKAELETYFVMLSYSVNPIAVAREGVAIISLDDKAVEVTVKQAAAGATIALSETSRVVNPKGQNFDIVVTCNDDYTAVSNVSWASFNKEKSRVEVLLNDSGEPRTGEIVFTASTDAGIKATLTVSQKAANVDPELIRVLAIGDSFTEDATANLYPVLAELGYVKAVVASVALDGKGLAEQFAALKGTDKIPVKITDANGTVAADSLGTDLLAPDNWDAIVLQPAFEKADELDAAALGAMVNLIRSFCEFTPLYWNMTWAYGADQADVYDNLADVAATVESYNVFESVIPVGTLVQNLRTSIFEETVVPGTDAHLSVHVGQLAASYLWAQVITGKNVPKTDWYVSDEYRYEVDFLPAIKEAIDNSVAAPYEVTNAVNYAPYKLAIDATKAAAAITAAGFTPTDYVPAQFTVVHNAYYDSTASSDLNSALPAGAKSDLFDKFAATHIIPKAQIPVGSLIVVLDGYKYRPEGWVTLSTNNAAAARPEDVTDAVVLVNDAWWGTFTYRAFNIAKDDGSVLTSAEMKDLDTKFGVFVPKTAVSGGLEDYVNGTWNW